MARSPLTRDSGQSVVEGVIGTFLSLALVAGTFSLCWVAWTVNDAFGAVQAAAWEVDPVGLAQASDKDAFVKEEMSSRVTGVDWDALEISGTTIETSTQTASSAVTPKSAYGESKLTYKAQTARIRFKARYTVPFTNGLLVLERDVDHTATMNARSEVS